MLGNVLYVQETIFNFFLICWFATNKKNPFLKLVLLFYVMNSYCELFLLFLSNMVCSVAGITSDANVLTSELRLIAQRYLIQYNEPIPCEQLVSWLCDIKQGYTQYGGEICHIFFILLVQDSSSLSSIIMFDGTKLDIFIKIIGSLFTSIWNKVLDIWQIMVFNYKISNWKNLEYLLSTLFSEWGWLIYANMIGWNYMLELYFQHT